MTKKQIEKMIKELKDALFNYVVTEQLIRMDIERYERMLKQKG